MLRKETDPSRAHCWFKIHTKFPTSGERQDHQTSPMCVPLETMEEADRVRDWTKLNLRAVLIPRSNMCPEQTHKGIKKLYLGWKFINKKDRYNFIKPSIKLESSQLQQEIKMQYKFIILMEFWFCPSLLKVQQLMGKKNINYKPNATLDDQR